MPGGAQQRQYVRQLPGDHADASGGGARVFREEGSGDWATGVILDCEDFGEEATQGPNHVQVRERGG